MCGNWPAHIDLLPQRADLQRVNVTRHERRLAGAGRTGDPAERACATLSMQAEKPLARHLAMQSRAR